MSCALGGLPRFCHGAEGKSCDSAFNFCMRWKQTVSDVDQYDSGLVTAAIRFKFPSRLHRTKFNSKNCC